jgi:hypothetical protein
MTLLALRTAVVVCSAIADSVSAFQWRFAPSLSKLHQCLSLPCIHRTAAAGAATAAAGAATAAAAALAEAHTAAVVELANERTESAEELLEMSASASGMWAESDTQHAIQAAAGEALMRSSDNKKSVRSSVALLLL